MEEEDKYDEDLLATSPPKRSVFSYDWSVGYVSPFRPSKEEAIEAALSLITPKEEDVFIDIGCGDGRVVIAAGFYYFTKLKETAKKFQNMRCIGIDIDSKLLETASDIAKNVGVQERTEFRNEDIMNISFEEGTILFLFLLPTALEKLQNTLLSCIQKGKIVISIEFPIRELSDFSDTQTKWKGVYLYRKK